MEPAVSHAASSTDRTSHRVVVYSDAPALRAGVRSAVGGISTGTIEWLECATGAELLATVDAGRHSESVDLVILDGEARPEGGLGLAKQLKDELVDCPATLVLIARKDDAWLAKWAMADGVAFLPVDAATLNEVVGGLLRQHASGHPVHRTAAL